GQQVARCVSSIRRRSRRGQRGGECDHGLDGPWRGDAPAGLGQGLLDEYQQKAIQHGDGPAIVLAGPGSGKTRVIVERAVRLMDEERARPEQLLILTFSRKAATDLRERVAARLQRSYASFPVTTFHAFALALLTRDGAEQPTLARPAARRRAMQAALAAHDDLGLHRTNALVEEALRFS